MKQLSSGASIQLALHLETLNYIKKQPSSDKYDQRPPVEEYHQQPQFEEYQIRPSELILEQGLEFNSSLEIERLKDVRLIGVYDKLDEFRIISQASNITLESLNITKDGGLLSIEMVDWLKISTLIKNGMINSSFQREAVENGNLYLQLLIKADEKLHELGFVLPKDHPAFKFHQNSKAPEPTSTEEAKRGIIMEKATKNLKDLFKEEGLLTSTGFKLLGRVASCEETVGAEPIVPEDTCDPDAPYRTMDGSCNNLKHPHRGAAGTPLRRILPSNYKDGVSAPRTNGKDGYPLPSARLVSTTMNQGTKKKNAHNLSFFHMTFGQFLAHITTHTPMAKLTTNDNSSMPINCCMLRNITKNHKRLKLFGKKKKDIVKAAEHKECMPIDIPDDDYFYGPHGINCMEFVRSAPAEPDPFCTLGPREQINQISAYLDGSVIYGTKKHENPKDTLRLLSGGLLNTQVTAHGQELLPAAPDNDDCQMNNQGKACFQSGDKRTNEVIALTFFHTIWSREHNRIAKILAEYHPEYDDEQCYQETRRIIVAQMQHIIYNEYLTTILPYAVLESNGMLPLTGNRQSTNYNEHEIPEASNAFSTAAYRFGHSQINENILKMDKYYVVEPRELSSLLFEPFDLYNNESIPDVCRGITSQRSEDVDTLFTMEVSEKLFKEDNFVSSSSKPTGLDLFALNIQRGKDHGLPGYVEWRKECSGEVIRNFNDLLSVMKSSEVKKLMKVYRNVEDIDLYVGGLAEIHLAGGVVGPTFACIITDQFRRLKVGDRFWYEEEGQAGSFTPAQMEALHNVSLARVLCNNIHEVGYVNRYPLKVANEANPRILCEMEDSGIPAFNLDAWQ